MRGYVVWLGIQQWCEKNPEKLAAVVTPRGIFEVRFIPKKEETQDYNSISYDESHGWVKKFFLGPQK